MARLGQARIGTSGFFYNHWREVLYPRDLPRTRWLEQYATRFDTVELNNTFYRLPADKTFQSWHDRAPAKFLYALKLSRYITHIKRLLDPAEALDIFLERADLLAPHLGPILVQLPPRWNVNLDRLDAFLALCPRRYRWAVEFRDPSWLRREVYDLLRRHGASLCVHDLIENHPREVTADFVYLRFHGATGPKYAGDYPPETLQREADGIRQRLAGGLDVYAYFNNDALGHAVRNATDLKEAIANSEFRIPN